LTGKSLADPDVDPEVYERQREALGLNDPIPVQYGRWISDVAKGDLGNSLVFNGRSVAELIQGRFANTFYLSLFSLFITIIVSIPIGIYSARKPYSLLDYGATGFGFLGLSIPNFFFGLLAIYVLSINLGCFPAQGTLSGPAMDVFGALYSRIHN